ncbi:MAG: O-antigen ligase family protein [Kiritimatiellales bacterium]
MKRDQIFSFIFLLLLIPVFFIYGIWEDKMLWQAPAVAGIYIATILFFILRIKTGGWSGFSTPPAGIFLLLFAGYALYLIPGSALPYEAKVSVAGLGGIFCVYYLFSNTLAQSSTRKWIWMTLLSVLIIIALYSLIQHRLAPELLFGIERYSSYWTGGRLGGTYQCPNHIAHLFQLWLPFCFVFLFMPQLGWFWRICCGYAIPLFSILIYQTQSRAGILGAIAGLAVTVLLLVLRRSWKWFCLALLIVPFMGSLAVAGLWMKSDMFQRRMTPVVKFIDHVVSGAVVEKEFHDFRPQTWLDTMDMIKDNSLACGVGPGGYGTVFENYRKRFTAARIVTVHAHNEYLELAAEYGLIGAGLALAAVIAGCVRFLRLSQRSLSSGDALPAMALLGALAGTAVHGLFDFELRIFPNAVMLAILSGSAAAPLCRTEHVRFPKWNRCFAGILFILIAIGGVGAAQVMGSAGMRALGDRALAQGDHAAAEQRYKISIKIDSENWMAHSGLGQIYYHRRYYEIDPGQKQKWLAQERIEFKKAYAKNPFDKIVLYGLGMAEIAAGNSAEGLNCLRRVAEYKRFNDYYWRKLGIELRKAGLFEESLRAFERADRLKRSNPVVQKNMEWLRAKMSETDRK